MCIRDSAGLAREAERWIHEYRAVASSLPLPGVWLEDVRIETRRPVDLEAELDRDDAWANVRVEMQRVFDENNHEPEEWEFQLIRAVLYEEKNCTIEEAEEFYKLYPDSTPLIDALKACILNWRKDVE